MGLRFHKAFNIAKILRFNFSLKGLGISWGIPKTGLRYGFRVLTFGAAKHARHAHKLGCVGLMAALAVKGIVYAGCFAVFVCGAIALLAVVAAMFS